ncbi:SpoIIE family protein phosphatase [Streptomyces sp. NPDC051020]|uniref:SpoIIE family protein phosphatase n=1 Tax=Streptomyces sp. NPDC051020 TaxID=3155409 RepID=UPI00341EE27B
MLLYTDGVIEARDHDGTFYPFVVRAAQWTDSPPEVLLHHIERDLVAHTGGDLGDDVALIAIRRAPTGHPSQRRGRDCPREAGEGCEEDPGPENQGEEASRGEGRQADAARQATVRWTDRGEYALRAFVTPAVTCGRSPSDRGAGYGDPDAPGRPERTAPPCAGDPRRA